MEEEFHAVEVELFSTTRAQDDREIDHHSNNKSNRKSHQEKKDKRQKNRVDDSASSDQSEADDRSESDDEDEEDSIIDLLTVEQKHELSLRLADRLSSMWHTR